MNKLREKKDARDLQVDSALAAIIRNTRTTHRVLSLPEIARLLETAADGLGGVGVVADRVGLSVKMLRQFLAVKELTPSVQKLFADRRLDSVDAAVHLRMLDPRDQQSVAEVAARGELDTADIRAVCDFRKKHADVPLMEALERVKATRNVKHYVVQFVVRGKRLDLKQVTTRFERAIGRNGIVSMALEGLIGTLTLNERGRRQLQRLASGTGDTKVEVIKKILDGELAQ